MSFPYIPLSWLRQQRKWAIEWFGQGNTLDDHDLWLWTVRQETERLLIEYYQGQLHRAATYIGIEGYSCPLCTYENGVFIKNCSMHEQIEKLQYENSYLRKKLGYEIWPGPEITTLTEEEWERAYLGDYYGVE